MSGKPPTFGNLDLEWDDITPSRDVAEAAEIATPHSGITGIRKRPSQEFTAFVPPSGAPKTKPPESAKSPTKPPARSTKPPASSGLGQIMRPSQELTRVGGAPLGVKDASAGDGRSGVAISGLDAVRDLYAKGETEAALEMASALSQRDLPREPEPYADIQDEPLTRASNVPPAKLPSTRPGSAPPASARPASARPARAPSAPPASTRPDGPNAPDPSLQVTEIEMTAADIPDGTAIFIQGGALKQVAAMSGTPMLALTMAQIKELPLDPKAGFLISMIDGQSTIPDLCDLAGMCEDDVVSVLTELAKHGVIMFG